MDKKKYDMNYRRQNTRRRSENRNSKNEVEKRRNIRYGTKFCGECRACQFWLDAKFGKFRCENSYLPFEILEVRRDGKTQKITEVVLNLLI